MDQGPDWYCHYCDKMVPHVDSKDGHHDEDKGGCGNVLASCKLDRSSLPPGWLREDVARAKQRTTD